MLIGFYAFLDLLAAVTEPCLYSAFGAQLGRCISFGSNFLGLHEGYLKPLPGDYRYEPLDNTTEGTVALLEACELLSYGKSELEAIFCGNGQALYG